MNLVERLSESEKGMDILSKLGQECKKGFDIDLRSRESWEQDIEDWMDLACQIREEKSWPWPNASNVKYPLISVAAIQFSARAYPSFIPPDGKLVKTSVIGPDPTGEKSKKGDRIGTFMSWQILKDMEDWEEDMDKLLITIAIIGTMFKKTFYDPTEEKIRSCLVDARDLVVNHWAKSLEKAQRVSEIYYFYPREVKTKMRMGIYYECELPPPPISDNGGAFDQDVESTPYKIIEQHCWSALDDKDEIPKPIVVTFEYSTGKVLRISPRFDLDGVKLDSKGNIKRVWSSSRTYQ